MGGELICYFYIIHLQCTALLAGEVIYFLIFQNIIRPSLIKLNYLWYYTTHYAVAVAPSQNTKVRKTMYFEN